MIFSLRIPGAARLPDSPSGQPSPVEAGTARSATGSASPRRRADPEQAVFDAGNGERRPSTQRRAPVTQVDPRYVEPPSLLLFICATPDRPSAGTGRCKMPVEAACSRRPFWSYSDYLYSANLYREADVAARMETTLTILIFSAAIPPDETPVVFRRRSAARGGAF
jgi:hypothetical protein